MFPFIAGQHLFFNICIEMALVCTVLAWGFSSAKESIQQQLRQVFHHPIAIAITLFVACILISSLLSPWRANAFWSTFERSEGTFQWLHYYCFFLLAAVLLKTQRDWQMAMKLFIAAALISILYAGITLFYHDSFFMSTYLAEDGTPNAPTLLRQLLNNRFQGTTGNAEYFAVQVMFALYFFLYMKNTFLRWPIISIFIATFFLTQTRGAILGLAAASFLWLACTAIYLPKFRKILILSTITVTIAVCIFVAMRDINFVKDLPGGRILATNLSDATAFSRLRVWQIALKAFWQRPLFGWGIENFANIFISTYDIRMFKPEETMIVEYFDRLHSNAFGYLVETGIIGLISYLLVFAAYFYEFWQNRTRQIKEFSGRFKSPKGFAMLLMPPAFYFVQALFFFDVLPAVIGLYLFFAFSIYILEVPQHKTVIAAHAKSY